MLLKRFAVFVVVCLCTLHSGNKCAAWHDESLPEFEKSTLVLGDNELTAVSNSEFQIPEVRTGKFLVSGEDDAVSIRNLETGKAATTRHRAGLKWRIVAT